MLTYLGPWKSLRPPPTEGVMWSERFKERWLDVENDGYINDNACWLLKEANRFEDMVWLVLQPKWTVKQLQSSGHFQISSDINIVMEYMKATMETNGNDKKIEMLMLLDEAAQRAANAVRVSKWNGAAWFQLYGRLIEHSEHSPDMDEFIVQIEADAPRPWLRPLLGCLPPAGGRPKDTLHVGGELLFHTIVGEEVVYGYRKENGSCFTSRYSTAEGEVQSEDMFWDGFCSETAKVECASFCSRKGIVVRGMSDGRVLEWDWRQKVSQKLDVEKSRQSHSHHWIQSLFCSFKHLVRSLFCSFQHAVNRRKHN